MDIGVIVYTDGSVGPTVPGYMGMGYHGYFYSMESEYKKSGDRPKDGFVTKLGYVCTQNSANFANHNMEHIQVNPLGYLDGHYADGKTIGDSNVAEYRAIKLTLEKIKEFIDTNSDYILKKLEIFTDSLNAISLYNIIKMFYKNHKEELDTEEKLNSYIEEKYGSRAESSRTWLKPMYPIYVNFVESLGHPEVVFTKVEGHSGNTGNEIADMLAVTARKISQDGSEVDNLFWSMDKYWRPVVNKPTFLRFRQLYFIHNTNNNITPDKAYFTVMDYGSIDVGKRSGETLYGIVRMDNIPREIVDVMENYQKQYVEYPMLVYTIDLDKLYKPDYNKYIMNLGIDSMVRDKNGNMLAMSREPFVYPIKPAGLAKRVYDNTNSLISTLETARSEIAKGFENGNGKFYYDITDLIYEVKGKKLNCKLSNGAKFLELKNIKLDKDITVNTKLVLGIDLPDRNTLKAMESDNPKVYVMFLREGPSIYSYYMFILSDTAGSYGVYHNLFSSRVYLENKGHDEENKKNKKS